MNREYTMLVSQPGNYLNWPGQIVTTSFRIRQLLVVLFEMYFARKPDKVIAYHCGCWEGFARDENGNKVSVSQNDHTLHGQWHTVDPRFFVLFAWHEGRFVPYIPPSHQLAWPGMRVICSWCQKPYAYRACSWRCDSHGVCEPCFDTLLAIIKAKQAKINRRDAETQSERKEAA